MTKQHDDPLAGAVPVSGVPFDECGFTTAQARQILAVGKTKFFEDVLPELESYVEGVRRVVTGRSIRAYRERRLAEPRQPTSARMSEMAAASVEARRRRKSKTRKENGATAKARAP